VKRRIKISFLDLICLESCRKSLTRFDENEKICGTLQVNEPITSKRARKDTIDASSRSTQLSSSLFKQYNKQSKSTTTLPVGDFCAKAPPFPATPFPFGGA
jgi:hypothetical protein